METKLGAIEDKLDAVAVVPERRPLGRLLALTLAGAVLAGLAAFALHRAGERSSHPPAGAAARPAGPVMIPAAAPASAPAAERLATGNAALVSRAATAAPAKVAGESPIRRPARALAPRTKKPPAGPTSTKPSPLDRGAVLDPFAK
ncbi:MAG: hypothetical protein HY906_05535 [Deltaproteobacteria bacterium]|nr:hypothetical protein [Deltaproteobacteria bacterium]